MEELAQIVPDLTQILDFRWVTNILLAFVSFLLISQLKDIKSSLSHLTDMVQLHDVEIAEMKIQMGMEKKKAPSRKK